MLEHDVRDASSFLLALWRGGRKAEALPLPLRPESRLEAYAIQAIGEEQSDKGVRGWKIAATSTAGQRHINVDGPIAGRLLAEHVLAEGMPVPLEFNRMRVAEVEFVFRMKDSLPPREDAYEPSEIMEAVEALHLGVEVPDSRFLRFETVGAAQLIADNSCADQFVLGAEATPLWRNLDLGAHKVQGRSSRGLIHEGSGANVLGDPRRALCWLVNELSSLNITLQAGQFVTTGTCITPIPVSPGDVVTGDFGALGTIEVHFA